MNLTNDPHSMMGSRKENQKMRIDEQKCQNPKQIIIIKREIVNQTWIGGELSSHLLITNTWVIHTIFLRILMESIDTNIGIDSREIAPLPTASTT